MRSARSRPYPMARVFRRWAIFFSTPSNAPPQMKRMLRRIDLDEFLFGVLAPALGRHVDHRSFENLQQGLLHAFARNVARDRRVVALAGDLVDLVDEDDAPFGQLDVVVGRLQQPREDALDILAHVARLGQYGGVDDGEGHLQQLGDRPGHQRLARTGRADQQDVRLVDLDLALRSLGACSSRL